MPRTEQVSRNSASALLGDLLESLTDRGRRLLGRRDAGSPAPEAPDLSELAEALLSRRGEASGVALSQGLLAALDAASPAARLEFLQALAERFGPDQQAVQPALARVTLKPDDAEAIEALHSAAEPRRQELLRRLNLSRGGTAALIRLRQELLRHLRDTPSLRRVDADFSHLFGSWFNRGFLSLRHIDWSTPANILEKIIRYEAVHAIQSWDDLRNRLQPTDRRCYGFFHPQLADEPLIFVEVALTDHIPGDVASLLDLTRQPIDADRASTAVFYSISNTQRGLAGVSFGNFLIKQVVEELKSELPNIKTFVTLSPVPGFAAWLADQRQAGDKNLLPADIRDSLTALDQPGWHSDPDRAEALRAPFMAAAAIYFLRARDRKSRPIDPVARFHLGNGARLERLNYLGDISPNGMKQSHGLMVNYLYDLDRIEANHEGFAERGITAAAGQVERLLPTSLATS